MKKCDKCHTNEVKIIIEGVGEFCLDCHNEAMAEELGVELFDQYSKNLSVYDNNHELHSFEISNLILPMFSIWRAEEIGGGYDFEVMVDIDEEQLLGIRHLHSKILRGVGYKSLFLYENTENINNALRRDQKQYGLKDVGTAGINYDLETEKICLVMDGKKVAFEEFGKMASAYEGYTLDYQIRDKSDEILGKDMVLKQFNINSEKLYNRFERMLGWFLEEDTLNEQRAEAFEDAVLDFIDDYEIAAKYGDTLDIQALGNKMIHKLEDIDYDGDYSPEFIIESIEDLIDDLMLDYEDDNDYDDQEEYDDDYDNQDDGND